MQYLKENMYKNAVRTAKKICTKMQFLKENMFINDVPQRK